MCYIKRCIQHLGYTFAISIIGDVDRSAHVQFYYIHNSCNSLYFLKTWLHLKHWGEHNTGITTCVEEHRQAQVVA